MEDQGTMEGLLQLLQLARPIPLEERHISNAVELVNTACKVRIYQIADFIGRGTVPKDVPLLDAMEGEVPVPMQDKWDFNIGDRVLVKFPLEEFRSIQKRTIGWNKKLANVHPHVGIVTNLLSHHDNTVLIHFPKILTSAALYAGVLKHAPEDSADAVVSSWKVGDLVSTKSDLKVLLILQRRLTNIPPQLVKKKGRVVAVTPDIVFVTFDGLRTFTINPAALESCEDQTPLEVHIREHRRELKMGEKVQVIGSLKRVIFNQKRKGGWSPQMCKLVGKQVVITDINPDDTIDVALPGDRSWRLDSDSVLKTVEAAKIEVKRDLEFMPGDKVKLKSEGNIRKMLDAKGIPLEFLEQLSATAVVEGIDDDLDAAIRYNCNQNIVVNTGALRHATAIEAAEFDKTQEAVKNLKIGDQVKLDVGQPRYVAAVLQDCQAKNEVLSALTKPARLVGYLKGKLAVIEYSDGSRYQIKKKYLTVSDE